MANDTPPTPAAPPLPANYDPNMGIVAPGLVEPGNIELNGRPIVRNDDGTHSSEYSTSFGTDKGEVLVPTIVNGRFLTPDGKKPPEGSPDEKDMFTAAQDHYSRTGQHLGVFDKPENADAYAEQVHSRHLRKGLTPEHISAAGGKTVSPAETMMKNNDIQRGGEQEYSDWLYKTNPEEYKKANPTDYFLRKAHGFLSDALTEPALSGLHPELRAKIEPHVRALADAGLSVYGVPQGGGSVGKTEGVKMGVVLPEGGGLADEDIQAVGGKTVQPAAPVVPDYGVAGKAEGIEFRGVQKGIEGLHPGLAIFQDPQSGTSIAVRLDKWSPEELKSHLTEARERMAAGKSPMADFLKSRQKATSPAEVQAESGKNALSK